MTRRLCIALHDVAPATWPQCRRLLDLLDGLGAPPLTLLIVPDWHGLGRIDQAPWFLREIERRMRGGDEVALHGYCHRDDAPAPRMPIAWLRRRVLTAGEGEFADLPVEIARARLDEGLALFAQLGWTVGGFVPPAWLASAGTRTALHTTGLRWTATHSALIDLTASRRITAPCLTASPRSAWRRTTSRIWLRGGVQLGARAALLRLGLHPADADHPELIDCWREVLTTLLARREPTTKSAAVALASHDLADRQMTPER